MHLPAQITPTESIFLLGRSTPHPPSQHSAPLLSQKQKASPKTGPRGRREGRVTARGSQPTSPGRPGGSPRGTNLLRRRWQELRRASRPAPGEGTAGGGGERREERGRGRGPPPPAQLQHGAARTTPGRIPGTVRRAARPCHRRPVSPARPGEGTRKYPPRQPTAHRPPRQGPRRPVRASRNQGPPRITPGLTRAGDGLRLPRPALQLPAPTRSAGGGQRQAAASSGPRPAPLLPPARGQPRERAPSCRGPPLTSRDGVGAPGSRPPPAPRRPGGWAGR
ncbi:basic salivary proline-rich protein 3-like [Cavia porcellus]|uniref:basic salivary proline-rich protein 3-like n=1 Tax=Cavia porcellus TaxID=10141 RepID=UPI002FE113A4